MAILDLSAPGALRLILSGMAENAILTTLRRWPHWIHAELERDPTDASRCLSVTLITGREQEATLREILRRGFGLIFPVEGGGRVIAPVPASRLRQGGRR
jgi:phage-related baseplate assembly protein